MFLKRHRFLLKLAALLLILVLGMMIANRAFYLHTHRLADGTSLVHAHPYQRSGDPAPLKHHQHNKYELTLIESLEVFIPLIGMIPAIMIMASTHEFLPFQPTAPDIALVRLTRDRAPPMMA